MPIHRLKTLYATETLSTPQGPSKNQPSAGTDCADVVARALKPTHALIASVMAKLDRIEQKVDMLVDRQPQAAE